MKAFIPVSLAAALAFAAVPALGQHHHHAHGAAASQAVSDKAEGTVKKVDKSGGKLTIAHGPLPEIGMPAMTMAFPVRNPELLDKVKTGDRIRFQAEQAGGNITVTAVEPIK